jgi:uncharacterized membrane protein
MIQSTPATAARCRRLLLPLEGPAGIINTLLANSASPMSLLHAPAPELLIVLGWLITVPAALLAARAGRAGFLPPQSAQHAWFAGIVAVAMLWAMHVRSPVGLDFGLLGSALFALVFGRARAIVGLLAALALYTVLDGGSWANFGINGAVLAVLPAWLATALQRQLERRLPHNVFVFIIGNGMFVTLVVTACTSALILLVSALEMAAAPRLVGDHVAYSLLLAWGEALMSGMVFSALVVFTPQLVLTYRQDLYLPRRRAL